MEDQAPFDAVNPRHYRRAGQPEVIDMMIAVYGAEAVAIHCRITAFKYRQRAGHKPGQSVEQEIGKARWYEAMADYLSGTGTDPRVSAGA
jgi:hypothetical protein